MVLKIVPRKFTVSDDVSYLGRTYDPRAPYPEKEQVMEILAGIIPSPEPGPAPPGSWFFSDFKYRRKITITNNTADSITNAPAMIKIDVMEGKVNSNWSDIRFTFVDSSAGKESAIKFLREYSESGRARFWIEIPSIAASKTCVCYIYYGNTSATNAENWGWMFASFNFQQDEGLIWIDNGIVENYGNSEGNLRTNMSRVDFVELPSRMESYGFQLVDLAYQDFKFVIRTAMINQTATPFFAVSTSGPYAAGMPGQYCLGMKMENSKAIFKNTYGSSSSSRIGNQVYSKYTEIIMELKQVGTTAQLKIRNNHSYLEHETFPADTFSDQDRKYVHVCIPDRTGARSDGYCTLLLLMKTYSSEPTYIMETEESK